MSATYIRDRLRAARGDLELGRYEGMSATYIRDRLRAARGDLELGRYEDDCRVGRRISAAAPVAATDGDGGDTSEGGDAPAGRSRS